MCRRCRRIYIRATPGPQPFPSHLSLSDSRENNPSPCDPALSPTSPAKRLQSILRDQPKPSLFPCPDARSTSAYNYIHKRSMNASGNPHPGEKRRARAKSPGFGSAVLDDSGTQVFLSDEQSSSGRPVADAAPGARCEEQLGGWTNPPSTRSNSLWCRARNFESRLDPGSVGSDEIMCNLAHELGGAVHIAG